METINLSVVIPAFNTGNQLNNLIETLTQYFQNKTVFEIIIVDDSGSKNRILLTNPAVKYFKLKKNYGQHLTTYYGIIQAKGQHILTLDDDVLLTPKNLDIIFSRLKEPYDLQFFVNDFYYFSDKVKFFIIKNFFRFALFKSPPKYGTSQRLITAELAKKIIAKNYKYIYVDALLMIHSVNKTHCINYIAKNKSAELKNRYTTSTRLALLSNSFIFYTPVLAFILYIFILLSICYTTYCIHPLLGLGFFSIFIMAALFSLWGFTTVVVANDIETA